MRACVHIYGMMSMHEEAVALALQVIRYPNAFMVSFHIMSIQVLLFVHNCFIIVLSYYVSFCII